MVAARALLCCGLPYLLVTLLVRISFGYITYVTVSQPLPGVRWPPGSPWPLPVYWDANSDLVTIDPKTFNLSSNVGGCEVIDDALDRYRKLIFIDSEGKVHDKRTRINGLDVEIVDRTCGFPRHGDDESYELTIPYDGNAELHSETVWGALRGLETFSQLVHQDDNRNYILNVTDIMDKPRYTFRGILLDTGRHFLPVKVIKQNLDAMSYNKFNVFHWHIVDDQSFPFESKKFPNLTQLGAFGPKHVYTQDQIRDVIQFARKRGIRVIPEFDSPGHTQAFGKAFPELLTPCYGAGPNRPYSADYPHHAEAEILNPMLDKTYDVVKEIVGEMKGVFEDEFIHLGMDEVYHECWMSSPTIKNFMKKNFFSDYSEVEQYYVQKTLQNVKDLGYKYMIWEDPISKGVKAENDAIVGVWRYDDWQNHLQPILEGGYQMVLSSCWYLNHISYGQDWKKLYQCDPSNFRGTEKEKERMIGGEVCMWGEYVDKTNLLPRLWPRASAVAERLWSPYYVDDADNAAFRLDQHRCRMLRRGIPAQPLVNGFCGDFEVDE